MSPEKKKETILEKAEHVVEEVVEAVEEDINKVVKKVGDAVEGKPAKKTLDKKPAKKTPAKEKTALEKLKEKAKALEETVKDVDQIDLKEKVKEKTDEEDTGNLLVPLEDYMKSSIHLGTRVITPDMRHYVYRRRSDGLAIFNTSKIDEKIKQAADFLAKFKPDQITVICKREAGWQAVEKFAEFTGVKTFTKKYPAGVLTNSNLDNFMETDLIVIVDPWLDKNALSDAKKIKIPVIAICDTNNYTQHLDNILIGNNKSYKSLGLIFYLLAKLYKEKTGADYPDPQIEEFISDWDNLQPAQ